MLVTKTTLGVFVSHLLIVLTKYLLIKRLCDHIYGSDFATSANKYRFVIFNSSNLNELDPEPKLFIPDLAEVSRTRFQDIKSIAVFLQ